MQLSPEDRKKLAWGGAVIAVAIIFGYQVGKDKPLPPTVLKEEPAPPAAAPVQPEPEAVPTTPAEPAAQGAKTGSGLTLYASAKDDGIHFSWKVGTNVKVPFGYKLVRSAAASPSFPKDDFKTITSAAARSFVWDIKYGETYNFRVCTWNGGLGGKNICATYSNNVKVTAKNVSTTVQQPAPAYVEAEMGLVSRKENDGIRIFWSPSTLSGFQSYKVVRAENDSNPYYGKSPVIAAITTKSANSYFDATVVAGHTYYYRVCTVISNSPTVCSQVVKASF